MSFPDGLRDKVKPELNNVYTKPAFELANGSWDAGWFCREHALHLFVLARLQGYSSKILLGDHFVSTPDGQVTTSLQSAGEHAWCSIGDTVPVDISLSVKTLFPAAPDVPIVFGRSITDPYEIRYYKHIEPGAVAKDCSRARSLIAYREREVFAAEPIDLLEHPYQFLLDPPTGSPKLTEIFGEDFFFQLTWHCHNTMTGQVKPTYQYRDARSACRAIVKWNPNARKAITEALVALRVMDE